MSIDNLRRMYDYADKDDRREGMLAYERYHLTMERFAEYYLLPVEHVVAAFVSLSPNSDYHGNLRSLASVLRGVNLGQPVGDIVVSTYKHCRDRAYDFARGAKFDTPGRGPKILAFYNNILNPDDTRYVTVDGHMKLAYDGREGTMQDAKVNLPEYREIAAAIKRLAFMYQIVPCEMQATIWFARKRKLGIKYNAQLSLFADPNDKWNTVLDPKDVKPYGKMELA